MGGGYLKALKKHQDIVTKNVPEILFERHMRRMLPGQTTA